MMRRNEASRLDQPLTDRWWLIAPACLITAAGLAFALVYWLRHRPNAEVQLRAIDAAHAVPEEQNAARDYMQLVLNGAGALLDPQVLPRNVQTATLAQTWRRADFPQAAQWIEERQAIIDALLQAGHKPQCWFSVSEEYRQPGKRFQMAYNGSLLLLRAANYDFAEGRREAGLEKLLCVFQMAEHFRSQMNVSDRVTGLSLASEGLKRLNRLLITEDVPQEWLARFEAALPPTREVTDKELRQLREVQGMNTRKYLPFRERLLYALTGGTSPRQMRHMHTAHLAEFRAARILLALRRHKDGAGAWPATLAEIQDQISPEALIDPLTRKPFVYRPAGDSLLLYNVGPNGLDEGGASGDDYPFWPPSQRWPGSVKH